MLKQAPQAFTLWLAGDVALGYDLVTSNISDAELERYLDKGLSVPDVVLVRTLLWCFTTKGVVLKFENSEIVAQGP